MPGARVRLESSDTAIATVSQTGFIRARRRGTVFVRAQLLSAALGSAPARDSFPLRGVVARMRLGSANATLAAFGDTVRLRPGFLAAGDAAFSPADSATITSQLQYQLLSPGRAVSLQSGGVIVAQSTGSDTVRASIDTCHVDLVVTVRQRAAYLQVVPESLQFHALGQTHAFTATARDINGASIDPSAISWTSSDSTRVRIAGTGLATAVASGAAYLIAAIDGLADSAAVSVTQIPSRLAFNVQPGSTTAGVAFAPAVTVVVQDSEGRPVSGATTFISVALSGGPGGAVLSGTLGRAAVNGVATFTDLSVDKAGSGYVLTASATGFAGAISTNFGIMPGPASRLVFVTQPSRTPKSSVIVPAVRVAAQDAFGNVAAAFTTAITVAIQGGSGSGGAVLGGTTTQTPSGGVATFADLTISRTGTNYRLVATASGVSSVTSASFNITNPTILVFVVQPSSTSPNATITPAVQVAVEDGFGGIATGYNGSVSVVIAAGTGTTGAQLRGTTTVAVVNGMATFANLNIDLPGTGYQLVASDPGGALTSDTSVSFDIR